MAPSDVAKQADEAGLRLVRFLWCGNDGTVRAKASAVRGLEDRIRTGIGLTVAMQAMNALDQLQPVEGMGPVGEIRLVPDPDTFRVLPYAPHMGAMLVDNVQLDGAPAPVCQRSFLKRMEARLAERGTRLEVAFENEFSLATQVDGAFVPIDSGLCFSTISATAAQDYLDELAGALEAQGIVLEQYYSELGHGQHEISTKHDPRSRCPARARRVTRAEALARERRQRLPYALLALGREPEPVPRRFRTRPSLPGSALVHRWRARTPPGSLRPDGAELQLLPPDPAAVLGGCVRLLGPRQP